MTARCSDRPAPPLRSRLGRADLIRAIAGRDESEAGRIAGLLGYSRRPVRPEQTVEVELPVLPPPALRTEARAPARPPTPFVQLTAIDMDDAPEERSDSPAVPLSKDELLSSGRSFDDTPAPPPLVPWPRLWPVLRALLQSELLSRELDIPRMIHALSRGELLPRFPRCPRRVWASGVAVWVDRSRRLIPFWDDQSDVVRRLLRMCGAHGVTVHMLAPPVLGRVDPASGDIAAVVGHPPPGVPVLVLSDLGALGTQRERRMWLRTGRRLRRSGRPLGALVPVPLDRLPASIARVWAAADWERARLGGAARERPSDEELAARVEGLLRLVSPALRVEPGLLRSVRRLMDAAFADAGTEADAWAHPSVAGQHAGALTIEPRARLAWARQLGSEKERTQEGIGRTIDRWHGQLPAEILHEEALFWEELRSAGVRGPGPGNLDAAVAFFRCAEAAARAGALDAPDAAGVTRHTRRLIARMPPSIFQSPAGDALSTLWALGVKPGAREVTPPEGLDATRALGRLAGEEAAGRYALLHGGAGLIVAPLGAARPAAPADGSVSPVGSLVARSPWLTVQGEGTVERTLRLDPSGPTVLTCDPVADMVLRTDLGQARLSRLVRPGWARAVGRDRYGLWAEIEVAGVVQRMRWIPPGRFWMGSAEGEVGRWPDEGPRHLVTLTAGFWLGDAPCTQELWTAVMGTNPSRFNVDPARPVERVSWDEAQTFLSRVSEGGVTGLRLPTEAEWERACRAGTDTATWIGDLRPGQEREAPQLDPIAWYVHNSGGTTHPVKAKEPNPFGLSDMLGNVWEWCGDGKRPYSFEPQTDPHGPTDAGSLRVIRGGSWRTNARYVRAAGRNWDGPTDRYDDLGLRLARGLGAPRAEPIERSDRGEAVCREAGDPPKPAHADPSGAHRGAEVRTSVLGARVRDVGSGAETGQATSGDGSLSGLVSTTRRRSRLEGDDE